MRARWLKPEFFRDKKIAALGPLPALVYQALWVTADDTGVAPADPEDVHSALFSRWSAAPVPEITGALRALHGSGRIEFYQRGDDLFALILRFHEHQAVHKPSKFRNLPNINEMSPTVPDWCGTGAAPDRHSPPPRHLDTQTPKGQKHAPLTGPALALRDAWASGFGPANATAAGRTLAPLVGTYRLAWVIEAIGLYARAALAEGKPQFYTVKRFAGTASQYILRCIPSGEMTEAEARLLGGEMLQWRLEPSNANLLTARARGEA